MIYRSSHWRCSVGKGVLRNFAKFTWKHLCQSLYFDKVAGLRPETCNFIQIETLAQMFSYEFWEISKNNSFIEHVWATTSGYIGLGFEKYSNYLIAFRLILWYIGVGLQKCSDYLTGVRLILSYIIMNRILDWRN